MEDIYRVPCVWDQNRQAADTAHALPRFTVQVPGSKSITNRALLLAALADGTSTLTGALFSEDSRYFLQCVRDLGIRAEASEAEALVTVTGTDRLPAVESASLYVGSAGTAARFLTALLGTLEGTWHMDASEQMRRRPMAPLLACLRELGCEVVCEGEEGHFPFTLKGHGWAKSSVCVDIEGSSQFLSALLISAALAGRDIDIRTAGSHGMAYIDMTLQMMAQFGVSASALSDGRFRIPAGQHYRAQEYRIEPDVSAACYFYAMAPLLGARVTVEGVREVSLQGDIQFLHILEQMGCTLTDTEEGLCLTGSPDGCFHGITADLSSCSDQAITLAAIAPFADCPTTITGIGHIRLQESDRLAAMAAELTRMGIRCEEGRDFLTIYPGSPTPCTVQTYDDHRLAMGFSLTGLRARDISIANPGCCRKTFENYFTVLDGVIDKYL